MIAQQPWVVIDTSRQREVRLALAQAGGPPCLDAMRSYDAIGLPTFTDALMRYQTDAGIDLRRMDAVLAISGAVAGSAISVARARWTVSRSGLAALFRAPPRIINDVAARAWALRHTAAQPRTVRGSGQPDLTQPGRYVLLLIEEGVGCAKIDIDGTGDIRIIEMEGGHTDFAAATPAEHRLADMLASDGMPASWEQVLMLDRADPRLLRVLPGSTEGDRGQFLAGLLGRFTVNMILATGAWNGALLTGRGAPRMLVGGYLAAFDASFLHRRSFRRVIAGSPCWLVDQPDPVLGGLAALVADRRDAAAAG